MRSHLGRAVILVALALAGCASAPPPSTASYDLMIRGGTVYDGSGGAPIRADVGVRGDRIAAIGELGDAQAARVVDAGGMAVAPGFVNVLSWAPDSLIADGRGVSDSVLLEWKKPDGTLVCRALRIVPEYGMNGEVTGALAIAPSGTTVVIGVPVRSGTK